jgi:hypothetical protein
MGEQICLKGAGNIKYGGIEKTVTLEKSGEQDFKIPQYQFW